jgi:DNA-binding beta-propeller fold protein YncE
MSRSPRPRPRRALHALTSLAVLATSLVSLTLTAAPAQAAWTQPSLIRSMGGSGEPGVYAWGIQYNPVSNEMLVGDYLNFQIRRYDLNGNYLGAFWRPDANGQPYSLAVDPRNGDILVPEIADGTPRGYLARYTKTGTFLSQITLSGMTSGNHYYAWIATDSFGNIWVQDAHYWNNSSSPPKIRQFSPTGSTSNCLTATGTTSCKNWGTWGDGSGKMGIGYGIALDASNNVYVADSTNKKIHAYTNTGTWIRDFGSAGDGVGQFTGDMRSVAIDKVNGWLYVNDADAGQVEKFSLTGTPLTTFGSTGTAHGQFADGGRQLTVTPDGDVWDADYGNWRFQRFSPTGNLKGIYPDPAQPAPVGFFAQPRGVAVDDDTGKVYVADPYNNRFQILGPDGSFQGAWGIRNSLAPYGLDYPRGLSFDQTLNRVWVLNTRAHNIRRYDANANYLDTLGSEQNDSAAAGYFRWPVTADFNNGYAYIGDYNSGVVKRLNAATGAEINQKSLTNNGVAVDPSTGNVYVVSWSTDKVTVLSPDLNTTIRSWGSTGSGNSQFQNPWGITIVNGVVYITDVQLSRVTAFDLNGNFVGKWGGYGSGPYQFANPSGITHDAAGNLYVADSANDRVQVYSTTIPKPTGDNKKPTVGITTPTNGSTVPGGVVYVNGTATDTAPFGVAKVEVAVQNTVTGLWWNAKNATWDPAQTWGTGALSGASITSMTYSFAFVGAAYGGHYTASVRSVDVSSITSNTTPTVSFTVGASPGDQLPPHATITAPALDAVVPTGPVTIQGAAGDNLGVAQVQVAIKDTITGRWFDPGTGTFKNGPLIWVPGTVTTLGALETTWSYVFAGGPAGSGSYYVTSRALDAAGNVQTDPPFTRYTVSGSGDTAAPETTISAPAQGQAVPSGIVTVSGDATDNVGVASVTVAIRDDVSGLWWDGSGWTGSQQWLPTTVFSPGGSSTGWSTTWAAPTAGPYTIQARARDAATNLDASPAGSSFTVLPPDTTVPTTTISAPANNASGQAPIGMSGTASDDVGVSQVRVRIRNNATLQWWTGSGWGGSASYVAATVSDPGTSATGWSYAFDPGFAGNFGVQVRSVDTSNNVGANTAWRNFTITASGSDTTGPTTALSTPTAGQSLPFGAATLTGTAADDASGASAVRVSVQDTTTSQWWNGSGWQATTTFVLATLDLPGGASTGWSYTFNPGVAGSYAFQARALDGSNNLGTSTALRSFTIQPPYVDTTAPTTVLTTPTNNASYASPVSITGTASDDVGVTQVRIAIRNNAMPYTWWNGSGWQSAYTYVLAAMDVPGGASVSWTYAFGPPGPGNFGIQVRSIDAVGNLGANTTWRNFTTI